MVKEREENYSLKRGLVAEEWETQMLERRRLSNRDECLICFPGSSPKRKEHATCDDDWK